VWRGAVPAAGRGRHAHVAGERRSPLPDGRRVAGTRPTRGGGHRRRLRRPAPGRPRRGSRSRSRALPPAPTRPHLEGIRFGRVAGISSRIPARQRQQASSPITQSPALHGESRAARRSATASCSPSSQAASARALRPARSAEAPVGSARRAPRQAAARLRIAAARSNQPSTTKASVRGSSRCTARGGRGLPSRPPRSSAPGRAPPGHDRRAGRAPEIEPCSVHCSSPAST
jgi:hypothetical protein